MLVELKSSHSGILSPNGFSQNTFFLFFIALIAYEQCSLFLEVIHTHFISGSSHILS